MKIAIPDLISNSYFPAAAAVELGFFKEELENAMISCGCRDVGDITTELLANAPLADRPDE